VRPRPSLSLSRSQRNSDFRRPAAPGLDHHHQHHQRRRPPGSERRWRGNDGPKAFDWNVVVAFEPPPPSRQENDPRGSCSSPDNGVLFSEQCHEGAVDPAEDLDVAPYRGDDEW
jgi:hypothetical protein